MFTLQSGQIETALRGAGVPDISAKEMMAGMANCQGAIEHRGGVSLTRNPRDNGYMFPGRPPAEQSPEYYTALQQGDYEGTVNNVSIINIPPWQNVPWDPIPYPEQGQWRPIPFPDWPIPQFPSQDYTLMVNGPVASGPIETPSVKTDAVSSNAIYNDGDTINLGVMLNHGPAIMRGQVDHLHRVIHQHNVVHRGRVVHHGVVEHRGVVHHAVAHNYSTYLHGQVVVNGRRMSLVTLDVVTDVEWDGSELVKKTASLTVLGQALGDSEGVILTGVSCPPPE